MDLLLPVFQLLYFVAHFLVSLYQAVYYTLHDVYRLTSALYLRLIRRYNHGNGVQVGAVSKLPSHPLLLLLPGQYSGHQLPQVATLLATLVRAGVRYLSAYDAAGKLRDQQHDLKSLLEAALSATEIKLVATPTEQYSKTEKTSFSKPFQQQQVVRKRRDPTSASCKALSPADTECDAQLGSNSTAASANSAHGAVTRPTVVLNVVSFESGTSDLMASVLKVARGGQVSEVTVDKLNMQLASRHFEPSQKCVEHGQYSVKGDEQVASSSPCLLTQVNSDSEQSCSSDVIVNSCACTGVLPDPDLVLVVGEYISSNGFPSWFLRLSEFVLAPDLHKLDPGSLTKILENYAKIEQRYGR